MDKGIDVLNRMHSVLFNEELVKTKEKYRGITIETWKPVKCAKVWYATSEAFLQAGKALLERGDITVAQYNQMVRRAGHGEEI